MKTKFNSEDDLLLEKAIKIHHMFLTMKIN